MITKILKKLQKVRKSKKNIIEYWLSYIIKQLQLYNSYIVEKIYKNVQIRASIENFAIIVNLSTVYANLVLLG